MTLGVPILKHFRVILKKYLKVAHNNIAHVSEHGSVKVFSLNQMWVDDPESPWKKHSEGQNKTINQPIQCKSATFRIPKVGINKQVFGESANM